jgi:hypothetical protein
VSVLLLEDLEDAVVVFVAEFSDDLEGSEKLGGEKFEFLDATEVLQRDKYGCRFEGSVATGNCVVFEGLSTKENFRTI